MEKLQRENAPLKEPLRSFGPDESRARRMTTLLAFGQVIQFDENSAKEMSLL